jgi:hypothetical protein
LDLTDQPAACARCGVFLGADVAVAQQAFCAACLRRSHKAPWKLAALSLGFGLTSIALLLVQRVLQAAFPQWCGTIGPQDTGPYVARLAGIAASQLVWPALIVGCVELGRVLLGRARLQERVRAVAAIGCALLVFVLPSVLRAIPLRGLMHLL